MNGKVVIGIIIVLVFLVIILGFKLWEDGRNYDLANREAARLQREAEERARKHKAAIGRVEQAVSAIMKKPANKPSFSERFYSGTEFINRVIADFKKVDTTDCPEEFRVAFLDYIHAVENRGVVEDENTGMKSFIKTFTADLGGPKRVEAADKIVRDAGHKIEQIASNTMPNLIHNGILAEGFQNAKRKRPSRKAALGPLSHAADDRRATAFRACAA